MDTCNKTVPLGTTIRKLSGNSLSVCLRCQQTLTRRNHCGYNSAISASASTPRAALYDKQIIYVGRRFCLYPHASSTLQPITALIGMVSGSPSSGTLAASTTVTGTLVTPPLGMHMPSIIN